ncbi:adenosylcobinamide-phosphate synthase CbiB [Thermostilla marina]
MKLAVWCIPLALLLDLCLGDPRWIPHPVRGIGALATWAERACRYVVPSPRLAGMAAAVIVVGIATGLAWWLIEVAFTFSRVAGNLCAAVVVYTTIAPRDLVHHASMVRRALDRKDLALARRRVGFLVGRDTDHMTETEVVRATVESVAENSVDGVFSPLMYAFVFGPVGAVAYRAVNTLDAMFGYRNERYREFGWASARMDDALNFLPARMCAFVVAIVALLVGGKPTDVLRAVRRDARHHRSPNAGYPEAAFAGALGVQLGGPVRRGGVPEAMPLMGPRGRTPRQEDIDRASRLVWLVTLTAVVAGTWATYAAGGWS